MAKKRKGKGGAFGREPPQASAEESGASRVRSGAFCLKSSLGVPFLVISDRQLVSGLPMPSAEEWREMLALGGDLAKQWDLRSAVVLADFEGEFTGLEGELVSAAFQRTWSIDAKGLRQMPCKGASRDMGLLVDLRSAQGAGLVRRVMESFSTSKLIWGADGDVTSLCYTPLLRPLGIKSTQVVDVQLAFSSREHRLSMNAMLQRLPPDVLADLPSKECIDFDSAHACNRRALHTPLEQQEAVYAVDDLHRLEAVLRSQKPKAGTYLPAQSQTSVVVSLLLNNIAGASAEKLKQYEGMLKRKSGSTRQAIAVRVQRHLLALRRLSSGSVAEDFAGLEAEAAEILAEARVSVPEDLSFSDCANNGAASASNADSKVESTEKVVRRKKRKLPAVLTPSAGPDALELGGRPKTTKKRRIKQTIATVLTPSAGPDALELGGRPKSTKKKRKKAKVVEQKVAKT